MITDHEELVANRDRFAEWDGAVSRSNNAAYKQHKVDVLEYWLDAKIPFRGIGNLFRFDLASEFEEEKQRIMKLPEFEGVNGSDQNGRPLAALNSYSTYLASSLTGRIDGEIAAGKAKNDGRDPNTSLTADPCASGIVSTKERVINCIEGLIELIIGECNGGLPEEAKLKLLARHMVQKSYFFRRESVDMRHAEILDLITRNEKIPVRHSTAAGVYTEENGKAVDLRMKSVAVDASVQRRIIYNSFGKSVPVVIDRDGNHEVRAIIERFSGARVSHGRKRNNVTSAIISHVWGNACDPLFFTNLWNIVVIPDYINSIMDKEETDHPTNFFERAVNYVKAYYKEICYRVYDMASKIEDYEGSGFHIRPFFANAAVTNIVEEKDLQELKFLEDQWKGK